MRRYPRRKASSATPSAAGLSAPPLESAIRAGWNGRADLSSQGDGDMTKKVFISHSSKDNKVATAVCTALESRGHSCWMSSRDIKPGENFQGSIVRAIREAGVMVLVFSSNANNSEEIKKEMALASQSRKLVIPVRAEDVTPSEDFTYELATRQWIDMFIDWEKAIEKLSQQIETAIPRAEDSQMAAMRRPPPTSKISAPLLAGTAAIL